MADQVVSYKGEFDASNIMSAIEKVYSTIKANNKTSLIGNLDKEIKKIETLTNTLQAQKNKGFASDAEMKAFESNVGKLDLQVQKLGVSFDKLHADNLKIELEEITKKFKELRKDTKKVENDFKVAFNFSGSKNNVDQITKSILEAAKAEKSLVEAQKEIEKNYDALRRQQINDSNTTAGSKTALRARDANWLTTQSGGLRANQFENADSFGKFKEAFQDAMRQINQDASKTSTIINNLKNTFSGSVNEKSLSVFLSKLDEAGNKQQNYSRTLAQLITLDTEAANAKTALINSTEQYNAVTQHSTNLEEQEKLEKEAIINKNNQQKKSTDDLVNSLTNMMSTTRQNTQVTKDAVTTQTQLMNTLDRLKSRIGYIFSLGNAYYQLRRVLKQTLTDVNNIDKAFASIAMVTEKTVSGLWEHYGEYATLAQKLGQSTESAIKTSALFYQQGLKDAEVMRLTEDTMKLATLAGLDFEKATSQMTAALRGFHMEMEESSHVTDVYSELAAHAAADVNGIAYAMSKTASIANSAGMSFENTAAFLTQMIETTQEAPENIGTALKTIIARFTELKENVAGTAESEFDDLDYNKVDKALKTVGISIKDTSGQFRNLDEVFLELSSKWNTLDRNSQRYIATIAAGSRQQSRFIAMMEDYDRVMELVNITTEAQGRADQQFAKNAESLQFKLQSLKTAWEQLRISFADSTFFKGAVDSLTKFVNLIGKMDKGQLAVVATIGVTIGTTIITSLIDTLKKGATQISAAWTEVTNKSFKDRFTHQMWGGKYLLGDSNYAKSAKNIFKDFGFSEGKFNQNTSGQLGLSLEKEVSLLREEEKITQELNAKRDQLNASIQEGGFQENQEAQILKQQVHELEQKQQETQKDLIAQQKLSNEKLKELGLERELTAEERQQLQLKLQQITGQNSGISSRLKNSYFGQQMTSGISMAFSSAVTTSIMTALSGADFSTIIKTALISAVIPLLSTLITAATPIILEIFTGPVGIVALIVAAILTGVALIIKKNKEAKDAEIERLSAVAETNKKLQKESEEKVLTHQKNIKEAETLEKYKKWIDNYGNSTFLTNEETRRLQEAQDYISENYEDVITETIDGHFKLVEDKMDIVIDELKNDGTEGEIYNNTLAEQFNQKSRLDKIQEFRKRELAEGYYTRYAVEEIFNIFEDEIPEEYQDLLDDLGIQRYDQHTINDLLNKVEEKEKAKYEKVERESSIPLLELKGYSKDEAIAASYLYPKIDKKATEQYANRIKYKGGLVENLSKGRFSFLGEDEEAIKKVFKELGYEDISKLFDSGSNMVKWGELTPQMRTALGAVGYNEEKWEGNGKGMIRAKRKVGVDENDALSKVIASYLIKDEYFTEEYEEIFNNNQDIFTDYIGAQQDYLGKTYKEYKEGLKEIREKNEIPKVVEALKEYSNSEASTEHQWDQYYKQLIQYGLKKESADKIGFDAMSQIYSTMEQYSEGAARQIISSLNSASLSFKDYDILGSIKLDDLSSIGVDGAQQYIDQLIEAGHGAEEAQKIFNDYITIMRTATHQGVYAGKNSVNVLEMSVEEQTDAIEESYEIIIKAQQEMLENSGKISKETYKSLKEAGFEEYTTFTGDGYALIADKAEEAYIKAASAGRNFVQDAIKQQEKFIEEAKMYTGDKLFAERLAKAQAMTEEEQKLYLDRLASYEVEYTDLIRTIIDSGAEDLAEYISLLREGHNALTEIEIKAWQRELVTINEAYQDSIDKVKELEEEQKKLEKTLEENREALEEAEQKYQEALHGTKNYRSSLDDLENYKNKIDSLTNSIENTKDSLESVSNVSEGIDLLSSYKENSDKKIAAYAAENVLLEQAISNNRQLALSKYGEYFKVIDNQLIIDMSYQTDLDGNDEFKKEIENYYKTDAEFIKQQQNNTKEQKNEYKEREKIEKEYLKNYTNIQEDVINILKESAQEEVDITKNKYEALKEADSDYISALEEAIQKQRDLRELTNKEDDLAQKEKKLSLMQRDTSGANAKEVKSLEEEINKDRQDLLDKNVDNIINNMKELYEKQAEARDAEIEYMESVTENAQYFSDWAKSIMDSWSSIEDMQTWFLENDTAVEDMTVEQQEVYINDLKEKWSDLVKYQSEQVIDVKTNVDNINTETENFLNSLSENVTSKSQYFSDEAERLAKEAIESAEKTKNKAKETLEETEKEYDKLLLEIKKANQESVISFNNTVNAYKEASQSSIKDVSVYATKVLAETMGIDLTDEAQAQEFAKNHNFINKNGEYSETFRDAVEAMGGDKSIYKGTNSYKLQEVSSSGYNTVGYYDTKEEAENAKKAGKNYRIEETPVRYGGISNSYGNLASFNYTNDSSYNNQDNPSDWYYDKEPIYSNGLKWIKEEGTNYWPLLNDEDYEKVEYDENNPQQWQLNAEAKRNAINNEPYQWQQNAANKRRNQKQPYVIQYEFPAYAKGGMVNYTGLAHVDGTPSRPEAFLSAEDTERFLTAAELFAMSPLLNSSSAQNMSASSVGDTSIEININVENIADDYDVDRLIQRVEDDIVETAKPIGTQVILNKRV